MPQSSLPNIWTASLHCDYSIAQDDSPRTSVEENLNTQRLINGITFVTLPDHETESLEGGSDTSWGPPEPDPDDLNQRTDTKEIQQLEIISMCALETVPRYYFSGRSYRLYVSSQYPETTEWLTRIFENASAYELTPSEPTTSALLVRTLTRQRERERNKQNNASLSVECPQYSSKPPHPPLINRSSKQRDPFDERQRSKALKVPLRHFVIYGVQLPVVDDVSAVPAMGLYAAELVDPQRFVDVLGMSLDSQIDYMTSFREGDGRADIVDTNVRDKTVFSNLDTQLSKKSQNTAGSDEPEDDDDTRHGSSQFRERIHDQRSSQSEIANDEQKEGNVSSDVENDTRLELLALRHLDARHRDTKPKHGNLLRRSISEAHGRNKESRSSKTERIPKLKRSETEIATRNRSTNAIEREAASDEGERNIDEEKEKEKNASMAMTTMSGRPFSHHLSSRSVLSGDANMNAMTSIASAVKIARSAVQAKRRAKLEKQLSACNNVRHESTSKTNVKQNSASATVSTSAEGPTRDTKPDALHETRRRRADSAAEKQKKRKESPENDENEEREEMGFDFAHEGEENPQEEDPKEEKIPKNVPIPISDQVTVNAVIEEYNKKAIKKLTIAALKSVDIDRQHTDFAEIWQQVYRSSRFTLRKDISLRHFTPDEMERVVNRHRDWVVSGPRSFA